MLTIEQKLNHLRSMPSGCQRLAVERWHLMQDILHDDKATQDDKSEALRLGGVDDTGY